MPRPKIIYPDVPTPNPENKALLDQIKPLHNAGMSQRRIAAELGVTPGRVLGLVYRYLTLALVCLPVLSGCTSTGYSRPPGVYVGPYDITLSSHREALGLDP